MKNTDPLIASRFQAARELIKAGDYDNARNILRAMHENATAQRWLAKLDDMPPSGETQYVNSSSRKPIQRLYWGRALVVGIVLLLLLFFLARYRLPSVQNSATTLANIPLQIPPPKATARQTTSACGIGISGHNARIWIEGQEAQEACALLTIALRQSGRQPTNWNGQLSGDVWNYSAVCSDQLPSLTYEVIDTGGQSLGSSMCEWVAGSYGASPSPTDPDLFGIVQTAQQAREAMIDGEVAETMREVCEMAIQQATADASAGRRWTEAPHYNSKTGECDYGRMD